VDERLYLGTRDSEWPALSPKFAPCDEATSARLADSEVPGNLRDGQFVVVAFPAHARERTSVGVEHGL
jgi:hypothetical protein